MPVDEANKRTYKQFLKTRIVVEIRSFEDIGTFCKEKRVVSVR